MPNFNFLLNQIKNLGIKEDTHIVDKKIITNINLFCSICIVLGVIYTAVNFIGQNYVLTLISVSITTNFILGLYLQARYKYNSSKFVLLFSNAFFFSLSAFIFKNNAHFFLLTNLTAIIILLDNKKIHLLSTIAFLLIILAIEFYSIEFPFETHNITPLKRGLNLTAGFGTLFLMIAFFKDILFSHQRITQEQNDKLEISNKNMQQILSIIAHDIRGPLHSIPSLMDLYEHKLISQDAIKATLKDINQNIRNVDLTIINLLEWASKNMTEIQTDRQNLEIKPIIDTVLKLLAPQSEQKKIFFDTELLENNYIYADPDHAMIILRNIISNAIKFSQPEGKIKIASIINTDNTIVKITDYGTGISPEILSKLTNQAQSPAYGTKGERGTGIGLLLSNDLITKNEGKLNFISIPNIGTTVEIIFQNQCTE